MTAETGASSGSLYKEIASQYMPHLRFVPLEEIKHIRESISDPFMLSPILADIFRINTLYMITRAGSGHVGTSLSAMDIITWLWAVEMQNPNEPGANPSDTYFSSKGHDVPGLYSLLVGLEKLDFEYIHTLRRLNGLPGHPDVGTPYMITNTGALGMGPSKARGMAEANRHNGTSGRFYVLCGDGELQEGQLWESLQPIANDGFSEITVIVDHNKIQSDTWVHDTSNLGDLEKKFRAFGWEVLRVDGHNFAALRTALAHARQTHNKPQVIIADTIKGKGVSFMERIGDDAMYKFHSGAPSIEDFDRAVDELAGRVNEVLARTGKNQLTLRQIEVPERAAQGEVQKLVAAHGDELVRIARERNDVIALDADLVLDTGVLPFKKEFPERYIECGIAEGYMTSLAGGLALRGKIPVVHSFECFLSTHANAQMYNNATEHTKVIYFGGLSGLLPAGPGHSHQSVRGISALGAIPGLTLIQPADEEEARLAIRWAVEKNPASTYLRMVSIPVATSFSLPKDYTLTPGRGVLVREGSDALIIAYGPMMLEEAYQSAELLEAQGVSAAVMNMPWLNTIDEVWLKEACAPFQEIITLDDQYVSMGQGTLIAAALARQGLRGARVLSLGVTEVPECGENREVLIYHRLIYHRLDRSSIAQRVVSLFEKGGSLPAQPEER